MKKKKPSTKYEQASQLRGETKFTALISSVATPPTEFNDSSGACVITFVARRPGHGWISLFNLFKSNPFGPKGSNHGFRNPITLGFSAGQIFPVGAYGRFIYRENGAKSFGLVVGQPAACHGSSLPRWGVFPYRFSQRHVRTLQCLGGRSIALNRLRCSSSVHRKPAVLPTRPYRYV
jgi:hypothetical protein